MTAQGNRNPRFASFEQHLDEPRDFYSVSPEIDAAVRHWLPKLKPITASQRATINALFNRPRPDAPP